VGRETLEEAGKAPEVVVVTTLGGTGRWKVVVEGNKRVQQALASMAWRLETCWRAGRVLKGDESALDGAERQCTLVLESTALVREGEWLDA
jgi:hypothetical protein